MSYPKRPPYFAHKFLRTLIRQAVALEIGPEGLCLLTVVALTEDAKGYTKPVLFPNDLLMAVCGFTNEKRLASTRAKCIAEGLLHYEKGRKGRVGRYWCIAPENPKGDSPVDENPDELLAVENDHQSSVKPTVKVRSNRPSNVGQSDGQSSVKPTDIHPIPKPRPIPVPEPNSSEPPKASAEPSGEPASFPVFEVSGGSRRWALPDEMLSELGEAYPGVDVRAEARKAWQWCRANPTKRKTAGGMPRFLNSWMERQQNRGGDSRAGPSQRPVAEHNADVFDRVFGRKSNGNQPPGTNASGVLRIEEHPPQ